MTYRRRRRQKKEVSVTLDGGSYAFEFPYHPGAIQALKSRIPPSDRAWDPDAKVWRVAVSQGETLKRIAEEFFEKHISLPSPEKAKRQWYRKTLDVQYVGWTKVRTGSRSYASGWWNGGWNLIFPEKVLREFFFDDKTDPLQATNLFRALGLAQQATEQEIKSAYRRLARQWHPDVCPEAGADARFRQLQRAYEILSDPHLRARYEAGLAFAQMSNKEKFGDTQQPAGEVEGYRSPLRCGRITCVVTPQLGRYIVGKIEEWKDILDEKDRIMTSSWPPGGDHFRVDWV
jgi:hypothetical protein